MPQIVPQKSQSPMVHFAQNITFVRSFIYSLVAGKNDNVITIDQFLAACNRYGIDNPCPIITKRLSFYGNHEEIDKEFKKVVEKYKNFIPGVEIDPDIYAPAEINATLSFDMPPSGVVKKNVVVDFNETIARSPTKKLSAI